MNQNLESIKRIKALADTGLVYAENEYDRERYEELQQISLTLLGQLVDRPIEVLKDLFLPPKEYPTPKVDIRGLVMNENKEILMVKEKIDGKWALPGGWGEIGFTPKEVIEKEIMEETGLKAKATRILAVYDKKCHDHPPQAFYVYKMAFLCEVISGEIRSTFDIEDVNWFALDELPELSTDRILASQIKQLHQMAKDDNMPVYFD